MQCITVSKCLLFHLLKLRGTRSISSCSSWWRQGAAPVEGSLVVGLWSAGEWRAVANPQQGRPPSMCVPPALPAGESRALHWRDEKKESAN